MNIFESVATRRVKKKNLEVYKTLKGGKTRGYICAKNEYGRYSTYKYVRFRLFLLEEDMTKEDVEFKLVMLGFYKDND